MDSVDTRCFFPQASSFIKSLSSCARYAHYIPGERDAVPASSGSNSLFFLVSFLSRKSSIDRDVISGEDGVKRSTIGNNYGANERQRVNRSSARTSPPLLSSLSLLLPHSHFTSKNVKKISSLAHNPCRCVFLSTR